MLNVDSTRERAFKVANELFEGRWRLPGIPPEQLQQLLRLLAKSAARDLPRVLLSLPCEYDPPGSRGLYQPGFSEVLLIGVRSPFRIDSRMPGIARR